MSNPIELRTTQNEAKRREHVFLMGKSLSLQYQGMNTSLFRIGPTCKNRSWNRSMVSHQFGEKNAILKKEKTKMMQEQCGTHH